MISAIINNNFVKDGSSCYCGYLTYTRVPLSNCNLTCGDNNGICGGNNLFSVYMGKYLINCIYFFESHPIVCQLTSLNC